MAKPDCEKSHVTGDLELYAGRKPKTALLLIDTINDVDFRGGYQARQFTRQFAAMMTSFSRVPNSYDQATGMTLEKIGTIPSAFR